MKNITVHVPRSADLSNKLFAVEDDALTLGQFLHTYLHKSEEELARIFVAEDGYVDFIVFINGTICRERDYVLADGDKILLNVMLGGG